MNDKRMKTHRDSSSKPSESSESAVVDRQDKDL